MQPPPLGRVIPDAPLSEYFLRTFEAFGFAALPMDGRIGIVQPLNSPPCECSDIHGCAAHDGFPSKY